MGCTAELAVMKHYTVNYGGPMLDDAALAGKRWPFDDPAISYQHDPPPGAHRIRNAIASLDVIDNIRHKNP